MDKMYKFLTNEDYVTSIDGKIIGEIIGQKWSWSNEKHIGKIILNSFVFDDFNPLNNLDFEYRDIIISYQPEENRPYFYLVATLGKFNEYTIGHNDNYNCIILTREYELFRDFTRHEPDKEFIEMFRTSNRFCKEKLENRLREYISIIYYDVRPLKTVAQERRILLHLFNSKFIDYTMIAWVDYFTNRYKLFDLFERVCKKGV